MSYVTLQEAADIVLRETGVDVATPQLIRLGVTANLPLCVLLNVRCYSPTHRERRRNEAEKQDPDYWSKAHSNLDDDSTLADAYGLFVLPPRHVFDFQTKDTVRIDAVTSLDGKDTYYPGVDRSRSDLQITMLHLNQLITHIQASKSQGPSIPDTSGAQENAAATVPESNHADTSGLVSWHAAILENVGSIVGKYGEHPKTWNVLSWCKTHGPRDVFPKEQPNERELLTWVDLGGVPHTITKGTVDNMLALWRKAGKFPPVK